MYNTNELLLKISSGQTHFPVDEKIWTSIYPNTCKKKLLYLLKG